MNDQEKSREFHKLDTEISDREEALIAEYKKTHKIQSRGIIDTPELKALREEYKRRFIEICEKYKG